MNIKGHGDASHNFEGPLLASTELIELRLSELKQLFLSFDPSPFPKRDLNGEAADFIIRWARETPKEKPLALLVHLERPVEAREGEILQQANREYFGARAEASRARLRHLFRTGRISLMIGLVFLAVCLGLSEISTELFRGSNFVTLLRESLVIGGWVAMWRPLEIFLYDWWPLSAEARLFDRLSGMPVRISYQGSAPA